MTLPYFEVFYLLLVGENYRTLKIGEIIGNPWLPIDAPSNQ